MHYGRLLERPTEEGIEALEGQTTEQTPSKSGVDSEGFSSILEKENMRIVQLLGHLCNTGTYHPQLEVPSVQQMYNEGPHPSWMSLDRNCRNIWQTLRSI